jgi:hypothetical protein
LRLFDGCDDEETPAMDDGTGLAEALLGLAGFRVLAVAETPAEVVVEIETIAGVEGCAGCGVRAEAQDRMHVEIRDLPCLGRPARHRAGRATNVRSLHRRHRRWRRRRGRPS